MKKNLFLIIMSVLSMQWVMSQTAVPYSENFNAYVADSVSSSSYASSYSDVPSAYPNHIMPNGWKVLGSSNSAMGTPLAYMAKVGGVWGTDGVMMIKSSATQKLTIILPRMAAGLDSLRLTFKYRSPDMRFVVGYTTSRTNANEFEALDTVPASNSLATYTLNFANFDYDASTLYMAIRVADSADCYISIDDVVIERSPREHLVRAIAHVDTAGTVTGGGRYVAGTNITITATPASGFRFFNWDDGVAVNPRSITVSGADTYVANFIQDGSQSTNLDIIGNTSNDEMGTVTGGGHYAQGFVSSLIAVPAEGYRFVCWSNGSTERKISTRVFATEYYTALFAPVDTAGTTYAITLRANNGSYGRVSGAGSYTYGTKIKIRAISNSGYTFVNWNDGCTDMQRTVTVTGNMSYIANFTAEGNTQRYRVSITSGNDFYGSVGGSGLYPANGYATALAVSNSGLMFQEWDNGELTNPYTFAVTCDTALVAQFDDGTIITIDTFTIMVRANNASLGTVSGGGRYVANSVATLVATPAEGAHFLSWNDGPTEPTRNVRVTANVSYVAFFESDQLPPDPAGISSAVLNGFKVFVRDGVIVVRGADNSNVAVINAAGHRIAVGGHSHECVFPVLASGIYMVQIDGRVCCRVAVMK